MAGTFSGLPLSQQFDINGNPLSGCLLYVYNGGTTTPALVYQDVGLTIPAAWPLAADASGRLPLFFVADGNYHLRLTDANGVVQLDAPVVPSIGPSSTGGAAVDNWDGLQLRDYAAASRSTGVPLATIRLERPRAPPIPHAPTGDLTCLCIDASWQRTPNVCYKRTMRNTEGPGWR